MNEETRRAEELQHADHQQTRQVQLQSQFVKICEINMEEESRVIGERDT